MKDGRDREGRDARKFAAGREERQFAIQLRVGPAGSVRRGGRDERDEGAAGDALCLLRQPPVRGRDDGRPLAPNQAPEHARLCALRAFELAGPPELIGVDDRPE